MAEAIRLIIWDLDETFWTGTLTEGGVTGFIERHHEIVRTLARRGIMSSICSRNDEAAVREVLRSIDLWDWFILPSVDWSAKAGRIARIVGESNLRASTVLFIDDNPTNLAEAAAHNPGLQVALPDIIPSLLDDPRLAGKPDPDLTRLAAYKGLERTRQGRAGSAEGEAAFLRASDIRVRIDRDLDALAERVIELLNRTNQMNFTKNRVPDDPAEARRALKVRFDRFDVQAGLVRVVDRYGDHGHCGFFAIESDRVLDFCFSCRIIGMGVERWLYGRLGRPRIEIAGEVVTDLFDASPIDWIALEEPLQPAATTEEGSLPATQAPAEHQLRLADVRCRGGCELESIAHYFRLAGHPVVQEANLVRSPFFIRRDCSAGLLDAVAPARTPDLPCLRPEDLASDFLRPAAPGTVLIFSGWGDIGAPHYRLAFRGRPVTVQVVGHVGDLTRLSHRDLAALEDRQGLGPADHVAIRQAITILRRGHAVPVQLDMAEIAGMLRAMFDRVPSGAVLYVLLPATRERDGEAVTARERALTYNEMVRTLSDGRSDVRTIPLDSYIHNENEIAGTDHFGRVVYHRIYERIRADLAARSLPAMA